MYYQVYYHFRDIPYNSLKDTNQIVENKDTIDWGIYPSLEDIYYPCGFEVLTQETITKMLKHKCTSKLTEAARLNFLNRNEGKYIYILYRIHNTE